MKNLKKPLLALLAVAVLIFGVALATSADMDIREEGSLVEAIALLGAVDVDDPNAYPTAIAQSMRAVDDYYKKYKLPDTEPGATMSLAQFKTALETARLRVQDYMMDVTEGFVDEIFNEATSAGIARERLDGVKILLGKGNNAGYFGTYVGTERYNLLTSRVKLAEASVYLRTVRLGQTPAEQGASWKALENYLAANVLDASLAEYEAFHADYTAMRPVVLAAVLAEGNRLADIAVDSSKDAAVHADAVAQLGNIIKTCYFEIESAAYGTLNYRYALACAWSCYRQVLAAVEEDRPKVLKEMDDAIALLQMDNSTEEYAIFNTAYGLTKKTIADATVEELKVLVAKATAATTSAQTLDYRSQINSIYSTHYLIADHVNLYGDTLAILSLLSDVRSIADIPGTDDAAALERSELLKAKAASFNKNFTVDKETSALLKEEAAALTERVLTQTYEALERMADIANDEGDTTTAASVLLELKAKMETCYFNEKVEPYKTRYEALLAAIEAADALANGNVVNNVMGMLASANAITDLAARENAMDKIYLTLENYTLDNAQPDVIAMYRAIDYAEVDILRLHFTAAMEDEGSSFDNRSGLFSALFDYIDASEYIDPAADAEYAAFEKAVAAAKNEFDVQAQSELSGLISGLGAYKEYKLITEYMKVSAFIKKNRITDQTPAGKVALDVFAKAGAEVEAFRASVRAEREKKVPFAEYDLGFGVGPYPFDDDVNITITSNSPSVVTATIEEHYGNKHWTFRGHDSTAKDSYATVGVPAGDGGFVMEFDITTFDTLTAAIYCHTKAVVDGATYWPGLFKITNGKLSVYNGVSHISAHDSFIIPGEWTHIAVVYNEITRIIEYYVNDQFLGTGDISNVAGGNDFTINSLRLGSSAPGVSSFSIDNLKTYGGTHVRDTEKFKSMTDEDRFLFYTDMLKAFREDNSAYLMEDVNTAYNAAVLAVDSLWDADADDTLIEGLEPAKVQRIREAVAFLEVFPVGELDQMVRDSVMKTARELLDAALNISSTHLTISNRRTALEEFRLYLSQNSAYISTASTMYRQMMEDVAYIENQMEEDAEAGEVIALIDSLAAAQILNAKRAYINSIEKYDRVKLDEIAQRNSILKDKLAEYDSIFAGLDREIRLNNTEMFIGCMSFFKGYADVEAALLEYDRLSPYMERARTVIEAQACSSTEDGYAEAYVLYERFEAAFYQQLQREHIAYLQSQVLRYENAVSFIEKQGVVALIEEYFLTQDIDEENTELKALRATLEIYKESAGSIQKVYENLLIENTAAFISAVQRMELSSSYTEIRELYDIATAAYYYMNVDTIAAREAAEIYLTYDERLKNMEQASKSFVQQVELLKRATGRTEIYRALVAASRAMEGIALDYEGVAEAKIAYDAAYENYTSGVSTVNEEIHTGSNIMCAVRNNYPAAKMVVAIFKKFFD